MPHESMCARGSNASPIEFGWDFQHNAGIVMMLANLNRAKAIRIEGKVEDIEITLTNGKKILAQAKSADKPDIDRNRITKFKKALQTLYKANRAESAEALVFITNNPDPFNNLESLQLFSGDESIVPYEDLTQELKDKIRRFCAELKMAFPFEKLKIWTFFFRGADENRYRVVRRMVREFIDSLELGGRSISVERLYNRWRQDFVLNASTTKTSVSITKKSVLWPVIAWKCELNREDSECIDLDDATFEEISRLYKKIIDDKSEDFAFVNRVLTAFNEYRRGESIARDADVKGFANERWRDYLSEFDLSGASESLQKNVVMLALSNIIKTRYTVNRMKERFAI